MTIDRVLNDWGIWVDRLSTRDLYYKEDFVKSAHEIDDDVIAQLGEFYTRAVREKHLPLLERWLRSQHGIGFPSAEEIGIRNLANLFGCLGQRDLKPFNSQEFKFNSQATADWSKLPAELAFLADPAEECAREYSYIWSEVGREQIQERATAADKAHFAPVADAVRRVGFDKVKSWYNRLGLWEHVEAAMVFDLMGLLDALDLPYFEPKLSQKG